MRIVDFLHADSVRKRKACEQALERLRHYTPLTMDTQRWVANVLDCALREGVLEKSKPANDK